MADDFELDQETYEQFIGDHETQLLNCEIPKIYWRALVRKLNQEIFDASEYFTFVHDEEDMHLYPVVSCKDGIKKDDPNSIFLIDHAWTYEAEFARAQLRMLPGLARRMALLMDLVENEEQNDSELEEEKREETFLGGRKSNGHNGSRKKPSLSKAFYTDKEGNNLPKEEMVELIFNNMWNFNQTYQVQIMKQTKSDQKQTLSSLKEQISFWYIMDEFGSRIRHSDEPSWNVKCFYYQGRGVSYSIMFPTQDLCYGDAVSRDFVPGITDPVLRAAVLYIWKEKYIDLINEVSMQGDIDSMLFSNEERCREAYSQEPPGVVYLPKKDSYNVFTDVPAVAGSIKEPRFHLVEKPDEADILWMADHFRNFRQLQQSGQPFINQFPFENVLTCKDLLARIAGRAAKLFPESCDPSDKTRPSWFQESFNLNLELPQFVQHFLKRKERNEDNIWIIKPWNLGRSMDTHVTRNLNHIIRLRETGPKIAFKYIHNPVLLERDGIGKVKFHFRYMPAVTCLDPLIIDVDKVFWIGVANSPFSLDEFDVYEKHFTTMNYRNVDFKHILYEEFRIMFDRQNPGYKWSDIEKKVHKVIKELFEAAASEPPPRGIGHCKVSRAYYALDFMLKWADNGCREMQPVLLEVNFNPDCTRLCQYHPDSFHHLFTSLFLGRETPWGSVRL